MKKDDVMMLVIAVALTGLAIVGAYYIALTLIG